MSTATEPAIIELSELDPLMEAELGFRRRDIRVSEYIRIALFAASLPPSGSTFGSTSTVTLLNRFRNERPHIGFNFPLEGKTSFALSGGYPTAYATSAKVNNFLMPACTVTQELVLNPSLSLATLYVDLEAFRKLIGESLESLPLQLLDSMEAGNRCYFESYQWRGIIRSILSEIFHSQMSPLAQRLFIESKSLELMAIILDIYARGNRTQFTISRSDIERIQYAKELLLRDMANPPSLSALAREAGTNEYTLKKGFKELFNVPVFKYLQEMRLAKAYELFQATNLQVSEVALIVGYESVSSFTRAFTGFYGVKPGEVKRIPFRTI